MLITSASVLAAPLPPAAAAGAPPFGSLPLVSFPLLSFLTAVTGAAPAPTLARPAKSMFGMASATDSGRGACASSGRLETPRGSGWVENRNVYATRELAS